MPSRDTYGLIKNIAGLMAAVSRNKRDTPYLYSGLLYELSCVVRGDTAGHGLFAPAISSQTKQFAELLFNSPVWKVCRRNLVGRKF